LLRKNSNNFHYKHPRAKSQRREFEIIKVAGETDFSGWPPGYAADLILIDMDRPHFLPRHNLISNLVHCTKAGDITHVIVDGQLILRNGELLTLDEERIKYEAERGAFNLVNRAMQPVRQYRG